MKCEVINFGSINIDYIYRVPHLVGPGETLSSSKLTTELGGKGANQSVAIAKAGVAVEHLGCISQADRWAEQLMSANGVNTQHVALMDQASGHAIIQVDDHGENSIVLYGGANQSIERQTLEEVIAASDAEYLLLQNECNLLAEAIEIGRSHNKRIVLNPAPMTDHIKDLPLQSLHTLIVNQGEAAALSDKVDLDETCDFLAALLPNTIVVITLGGEGAIMLYNGEVLKSTSPAVNVVDTTGAGDTFVGYFLAGVVDRLDPAESLTRACAAASLAVTKVGAIPSIPNIAEVG